MVKQNLPYLDSGHKEVDDAIDKSPQPKDISEMASYDTHDGCFFRCLFLGKIYEVWYKQETMDYN